KETTVGRDITRPHLRARSCLEAENCTHEPSAVRPMEPALLSRRSVGRLQRPRGGRLADLRGAVSKRRVDCEWIAITDGAADDKPRWSPDGATLYFLSKRDGFRCIWAQRVDARKHPAGQPIPIFHAHEARRSMVSVGRGDLGMSVARDKI